MLFICKSLDQDGVSHGQEVELDPFPTRQYWAELLATGLCLREKKEKEKEKKKKEEPFSNAMTPRLELFSEIE